jgi:hypothetical protein
MLGAEARTMSTTEASPAKKSVLLIGLDPKVVDFSGFPGLDEQKLRAGLQASLARAIAAGFDAAWCLTDSAWAPAEAMIREHLAAKQYAAIMIGAGIRTAPDHFLLFERVVNLVHAAAPGAVLCFNTSPDSTTDALLRWLTP